MKPSASLLGHTLQRKLLKEKPSNREDTGNLRVIVRSPRQLNAIWLMKVMLACRNCWSQPLALAHAFCAPPTSIAAINRNHFIRPSRFVLLRILSFPPCGDYSPLHSALVKLDCLRSQVPGHFLTPGVWKMS